MELSVNALQEAGAFTGAPVEKEIRWQQDGKKMTATAFVRKLSYRSVVSDAIQSGADVAAGRIATCICDKAGKPVFTVDDITGNVIIDKEDTEEEKKRKAIITERGPLNHDLTIALLNAIAEVNYPSGKKTLGKQTT